MRLSETQKIKKVKKSFIKIINNKKKEYKYLTYPIDCSYGKAIFTKIKCEYLDLLPKILLHFDIDKDKAEKYIKKNGIESIKKQIAKSIGDNDFAIIEIAFGSLFMQLAMLGPIGKDKIKYFLQKNEWDERGLIEIKEKLQKTLVDFGFITVKPKYAEIYNNHNYDPEAAEKMINEVLELNEEKSEAPGPNENVNKYLIKKADEVIETLTRIAQEKEIQETMLIELNEGLELKESLEKTNTFIEQKQKESIFEFKIVGLSVVNNINREQYLIRKSRCQNCKNLILINGTKIKYAAKDISQNFITGRDNWYGIGTYFTDQLDYATYYSGEKTLSLIPSIGDTFPLAGAEVFYDKTKFKQIYDYSYEKSFYGLGHLPTEEDIQPYIDKTIEKDGIHFIEVDGYDMNVITKNRKIFVKNKPEPLPKERYIGREYAVTDKTQILPLFALTMKRVEYCVIWRDNNFSDDSIYKDYLEERKKWIKEMKDFNLYIETSTEDALKLIWQKKYNKIILITNVGSNLEGKNFINKARKILGFNAITLFFANSLRHLEWIKNYPNSLFTDNAEFFEKYIMSFGQDAETEENLNKLKSDIEQLYNIKLQNLNEPVKYPLNHKNFCNYGELDCSPFKKEPEIGKKKKNIFEWFSPISDAINSFFFGLKK